MDPKDIENPIAKLDFMSQKMKEETLLSKFVKNYTPGSGHELIDFLEDSSIKPVLNAMEEYAKQKHSGLQADIKFLAERQLKSGSFSFNEEGRDTGVSSNSIVAIAYGLQELEDQRFPGDVADMMACERMWKKLPEHRKKGKGLVAMEGARTSDYHGKKLATDK